MTPNQPRSISFALTLGALFAVPACTPAAGQLQAKAAAGAAPEGKTVTVTIDGTKPLRTINKRRFLGSNIAVWHQPATFESPVAQKLLTDAGVGLLRLPGGSASDQYFWNGNGVRKGDVIDKAKYKKGHWEIDYSSWSPGFFGFFGFPDPAKTELQKWQGNSTVKQEFEFAKALGVESLVTVNAGTGTPKDAAEWVKWVQKNKYNVKFWEVGNELGGNWESGTVRADGKSMDAKMYTDLYAEFAKAMKAVDPTILIGSEGGNGQGIDFARAVLERKDLPVDFITYHDYYSADNNPEAMFKVLDKIRGQAQEARDAANLNRPGKNILIGMSEFNCKLFEDEGTSDVNSGLWLTGALGEMVYGGLDFATQWDTFTQKKEQGGGHGFIVEEGLLPKAQYWSYYILNRYLEETILDVDGSEPPVRTYVSKGKDGSLSIIALNTSQKDAYDVTFEMKGGGQVGPLGDCVRFSEEEYGWDPAAFVPAWNNSPTKETLRVGGAPLHLPKASTVACKVAAASGAKLAVSGPTSTVIGSGAKTTVDVVAVDGKGKAAEGVKVSAKAPAGFTLSPDQAKTGGDGIAHFTVTAPKGASQGAIDFSASDYPALSAPVSSVEPSLFLLGTTRVPAGEPAPFVAAARYKDGGTWKLLQTFAADGSLTGAGAAQSVKFEGGLAKVTVSSPSGATKSLKLASAGLTGGVEVTFFDRVNKDVVAYRFDEQKNLDHATGKVKYKINKNVKPNEGVLEIPIDGLSGWSQDLIVLDKINETPNLERAGIRAVTLDLMASNDVDAGSKYAELIFVLQGELNWWMPLEKIEIAKLPKGKWQHLVLPIKNAEWQKAMRAFVKMDVVVNSGSTQKGTLYIDNLGFQVEAAK